VSWKLIAGGWKQRAAVAAGCVVLAAGLSAQGAPTFKAPVPRFADPGRRAKLEKAFPEIDKLFQDYATAVSWAAQTGLRDIIGRTSLSDLLRGRERIESELQKLIDERSTPWGVTVQSVEMRDVVIPASLQDAMSREAQASREKQARIILGQAEVEIANLFSEASKSYHDNPTALHLRAMNILYEGLKEKGALMLVPSTAVESMGLGGLLGAAAMRQDKLSAGEGN